MTKTNYKYYFTAYYDDGSYYNQPSDDVSSDGKSSAYSDVQQDKLVSFALYNKDRFFALNLKNGEYSTNAGKFSLHREILSDFKLLYCRLINYNINSNDPTSSVRYYLGYTAKDNSNKSVQHGIIVE